MLRVTHAPMIRTGEGVSPHSTETSLQTGGRSPSDNLKAILVRPELPSLSNGPTIYVRTGPAFGAETARPQRAVAEPSSSQFSFMPYVAVPEGLSAREYDERRNLNTSVTAEPAHDQAYPQSATSHGLPGILSAEDFVSPLLDSVLLDLPEPPPTVDGSSSDAGQGDTIEESPIKTVTARKGKQRLGGAPEQGLPTLRRFRKKTEIACNFCRGKHLLT